MTTGEFITYGVVALVGVALSAFFSGSEIGLYTINRVRLIVRANRGEPAALRLQRIMDHPNRMLSTILIGNNIANYLGSFGIAAILDSLGYAPVAAIAFNAAVLIPLLFIFGEVLPKDLFRTHTDQWSYACSWLLRSFDQLFTYTGLNPIVQGFGDVLGRLLGSDPRDRLSGRQRMSQLIKEGVSAGVLSESQTTLADRAIAMREHTVETEMVPWSRVGRLRLDADADERERIVRQRHHTRMPVVGRDGRVVGVIRLLDVLLEPDKPTQQLMVETIEFTPGTPVRDAIRAMREGGAPIAIVVAERTRRPLGVVTLKDLVEPLVGELAAW